MKIGIIGTGHIGSILARLWSKCGHDITVSCRNPQKLESFVKELGPRVCNGTVEEAARFGEVVVLAIPLGAIKEVSTKVKKYLDNKVVIDCMNPFVERDGEIAEEIFKRGIASGEATRERFPSAKIVRAFSSIRFSELEAMSNRTPRIAVPMAADDDQAKEVVMKLIRDAGFDPFDLGKLERSKPLDPGGILFVKSLTDSQITELLMR